MARAGKQLILPFLFEQDVFNPLGLERAGTTHRYRYYPLSRVDWDKIRGPCPKTLVIEDTVKYLYSVVVIIGNYGIWK